LRQHIGGHGTLCIQTGAGHSVTQGGLCGQTGEGQDVRHGGLCGQVYAPCALAVTLADKTARTTNRAANTDARIAFHLTYVMWTISFQEIT